MSAVEQYFAFTNRPGTAEASHTAVVAVYPAQSGEKMPPPALYGHPRADENARLQGDELLAATAMNGCPVFRQLISEQRTAQEVLHEVHASLAYILGGNKAMFVPANEIQALMYEIGKQAEQFVKERRLNPSAPIARLRAAIGPGSHFAHRHHQHLLQHHPEHPMTHEPYGSKASHTICGHLAEHLGVINHEFTHHFSHPPEYS